MSETPTPEGNESQAPTQNPQGQPGPMPVVRVVNQYVKDLSFENPNAPMSVQRVGAKPDVQMEVNLGARPLGPDFPMGPDCFEIEMSISATAKEKETENVQYVVETNYAGLMVVQNVPQEHIGAVLLVEGPQLLFPFARQVIADAVRDGGFTPLMLEPLDFAGMYRQQMLQQQQAAAAGDSSAPEVGSA